jgi:catechol 2,3-dioxygenase-like lactoylglutathione lyase family enzyme
MRKVIILLGVVAALLCLLIFSAKAQTKLTTMKLNAGFVTPKLQETKKFYTTVLQMGIVFENEFYLLLQTDEGTDQISFLLPNHESQQPLFKPTFAGKGAYLTIEVEKVDEVHNKIKKMNIPIAIALRNEPWGDRHFAIVDPNGIGIDIVTYNPHTK